MLAPIVEFRSKIASSNLITSIAYAQSSLGGGVFPVKEGENSDLVYFRIYNNYAKATGISSMDNVAITTYDGVGVHTATQLPISQSWIRIYETGFGETLTGASRSPSCSPSQSPSSSMSPSLSPSLSPSPSSSSSTSPSPSRSPSPSVSPSPSPINSETLTCYVGEDTAIGQAGTDSYTPEYGSDGTTTPHIRAGANHNGVGFIEFATYAQVPQGASFNNFSLCVSIEYSWTS